MPTHKTFTLKSIEAELADWLKRQDSLEPQATAATLRVNMVTLLTFVRDNRVVGTQTTGNMPLKAIREIAARFNPPLQLETKIGNRTFPLRTEEQVGAIHFPRILAEVGHLIQTGRVRRWQVTVQGQRWLEIAPPLQAAFLLAVWWYKTNWLIAYPYAGMGDHLPYHFTEITFASLRELPTGSDVSFNDFANQLIRKTGLAWTARNVEFATLALRASIRHMVVAVLEGFHALKSQYRDMPIGKGTIPELDAIRVTPWGKALLEAMAILGDHCF